ncbi:MFS transporter [Pontiellaceae bacterium B1224]|nr:MFS transporter [Pontiellaceae bacterium B1224]
MSEKTSYTTRFSYAASDMGGQFIFQVVNAFLLIYCTDVLGLSATTAGTIWLIARLEDALDSPIWGIFLDKTNSKYGKSRPWFLWLCIPYALLGLMLFYIPDLGELGKAWYFGTVYVVFGSIYTGINTPVTSILSTLTSDSKERVTLTSFRMIGSKLGVLIVSLSFLRMVDFFGKGDEAAGHFRTMIVFGIASILCYLFAFKNLREVVQVKHERIPIKDAFRAFKGNWPWLIIFASSFCFWIAFIARFATVNYFFKYCWGDQGLVSAFFGMDVISLGAIFLIPFFCKFSNKSTLWAVSLFLSALAQLVLFFGAAQNSLPLLYVGWIAGIFTSGVALALPFSLMSDSVDYGEWKTGVRAVGLLTAVGTAFCLKAGSGFGGAVPAWVMGYTGFDGKLDVQTDFALAGISFGFIWIPAIFYGLALIPVLFYGRFEKLESKVQEELQQRRGAVAED